MNICDSDTIDFSLSTIYGASKVTDVLYADVVILNTCSVRSQSEQKAFSYIGRLEEFKLQNPNLKIVIIGCMAERLGYKIKKRFSGVDLIIGSKDINITAFKIINLYFTNNYLKKNFNYKFKVIEYVTITSGCNNYCSYCIVPFVRGIEKSINYQLLIDKCSLMAKNGTKEVMLLGQNVNSYKYNGVNFSLLLKRIASIENLYRIRFMTNHPNDFDDKLIDTITNEYKICPHIHLPMQSASNKILKAMNRKYTYEYYFNLVNKLRKKIPGVSITTDIIVGFPNETERDFNDTLNAIKTIKFDGLYVFKYSARSNTTAFKMFDTVTTEEKKRRHSVILKESNKISAKIISKMIGSTQQVLAEKFDNGIIKSRTRTGHKVFINGSEKYVGKIFNVIIKSVKVNSLYGSIINKI
jgi:tRNA-2-methylthio-N6-dimethylallyladenosine synthase